MLFNSLSVALIIMIVPWSTVVPGQSPFVLAMQVMGIPGAAPAMRIVVLTAILSCMNSSLYITSRIMAELAQHGDAPALFQRRAGQAVPVNAILANSIAGGLVAFSSILAPGTVFAFLLSCSGGVMLLVYSLVVTAYVVVRRRTAPDMRGRFFSIPCFPALNFLTLAGVIIIFAAMLFDPGQRMVALASLGTSVFFVLVHGVRRWLCGRC